MRFTPIIVFLLVNSLLGADKALPPPSGVWVKAPPIPSGRFVRSEPEALPEGVERHVWQGHTILLRTPETRKPATIPWSAGYVSRGCNCPMCVGIRVRQLQGRAAERVFEPTPIPVAAAMLEAGQVKPDDVVVDLGCGDGRIPILATELYEVDSVGVEIQPDLCAVARDNVSRNCLEGIVTIYEDDAARMQWTARPKVVTVWLSPPVLSRLRPVLDRLPVGSRLVSRDHPIPGWPAAEPINADGVRIYRYRMTAQTRNRKVCGPGGCSVVPYVVTVAEGF